jgi:hypothetical protein
MIRPVYNEDTWDYHDADYKMASSRLERLSSGDLQILNSYLHANSRPTIEGLAEFAAEVRDKYGSNPRLDLTQEEISKQRNKIQEMYDKEKICTKKAN